MDLNEYIVYEIMKLESDNSTSLFNSLNILEGKVKVDLLSDEKHKLYYQANIKDILKTDIDADKIIQLRNGGWELSDNKKHIVKFL